MGSTEATEFFNSLPSGVTARERQAREDQILAAVKSGLSLPPDLREIRSEHAGRTATIRVMRDAIRIGCASDSVRPAMTPIGAQRIADALGLMLPTAKIVHLAWLKGFPIDPCTFPADASMATTKRIVDHSRAVDQLLLRSDPLLVVGSNVGKHWVLSNVAVGKTADGGPAFANFGWFREPSNVSNVWQPLSTKHNTSHVDYSQIVWLVDPIATLDGKQIPIAKLAIDPELAPLVFAPVPYDSDALTLSTFRVPGVQLPTEIDAGLSLDCRALAWCLAEAGRYGSRVVDAARIREYLSGCVRNGKRIGITSGNFCSAAQGFAEHSVALDGEEIPPWRAAAKEHIADAKERSDLEWHPVDEVLAGSWAPPPGAKAIYHRGAPGAWTGHIDRVIETLPAKNGDAPTHYRSVGANEGGGRWIVDTSSFANPALLGFVTQARDATIEDASSDRVPDDTVETELTESERDHLRWITWETTTQSLAELRKIRDRQTMEKIGDH